MSALTLNCTAQTVCAVQRFVLTRTQADAQKSICTSSRSQYFTKLYLYCEAASSNLNISRVNKVRKKSEFVVISVHLLISK